LVSRRVLSPGKSMQIDIKLQWKKKKLKFDIEPDETVRLFLCAARAPVVAVLDPTHTHTHTLCAPA
jgi:hypothetical protein